MTGVLDTRRRGAFALLGVAVLYGSSGVLVRILDTLFGENTQVAVRFAVAAVLLAGITLWWGNRAGVVQLVRKHFWRTLGLAVAFTVEAIFYTIAVNRTTLANTLFLSYAGAIAISLTIGTLLLGERMTRAKIGAIVIALMGLAMYAGSLVAFSAGVLAALAAGIFDGIANGLRRSLIEADFGAVLMVQYSGGTFVALLIALIVNERLLNTTGGGTESVVGPLLVALAFGVSTVCIGYLLLYGFGHFDLNVGTILLTTEIGFAALFGLTFYGEVPSLNEAIAGVLVFAAATLAVMGRTEPCIPAEANVQTSAQSSR